MKNLSILVILCFCAQLISAQDRHNPSFEEVISLRSVYGTEISPDGQHVVFIKNATDWENNRFESEIWMSRAGGEPFQLTNNPKNSSSSPRWSPDGKWIAFLSNRGSGNQLYVIRADGGEAMPLTSEENGISSFQWSPDGSRFALLKSEDNTAKKKKVKEAYGEFVIDDGEYNLNRLWLLNFDAESIQNWPTPAQKKDSTLMAAQKPQPLMDSATFSITGFSWSPDGTKIALNHQPNPLINTFFKSDISILDVASKDISLLVSNPSYDGIEDWSPDSRSILYSTSGSDTTSNYYKNDQLFKIDIDGTNPKELAADFDEYIGNINWTTNGIYGVAWQKTIRKPLKISDNGKVKLLDVPVDRLRSYSVTDDGSRFAFSGSVDEGLVEVYLADKDFSNAEKITNTSGQISNWAFAKSEVVSWKSEDGAEIEGILHKPMDYDPAKKYPLLVIIHGGPTGISTPDPTPAYVYPMLQWLNKGALILRPNYRGSAGYGEAFRSLNVRNLGVGDAWDVVSGVNYLDSEGLIDMDKVGAMGWSQGGYISAFLTTNTTMFKAISVGAGISNWMTYYVNTDIHPFTRQYLKATPWSDKEIYELTSPMTNINNASTPTLIQHGEFDRRVPIANAYELVQGLRDNDVSSELIVYKGFGHGISKPKERLAAMWHNWQWFAKYIWGEEIEMPE